MNIIYLYYFILFYLICFETDLNEDCKSDTQLEHCFKFSCFLFFFYYYYLIVKIYLNFYTSRGGVRRRRR